MKKERQIPSLFGCPCFEKEYEIIIIVLLNTPLYASMC